MVCTTTKWGGKYGDDQPIKVTSVKINGKTIQALIDTSSDHTLVRRQYLPVPVVLGRDLPVT